MKKSNIICLAIAALSAGYGIGMTFGQFMLKEEIEAKTAYIEELESYFTETELEMIRR